MSNWKEIENDRIEEKLLCREGKEKGVIFRLKDSNIFKVSKNLVRDSLQGKEDAIDFLKEITENKDYSNSEKLSISDYRPNFPLSVSIDVTKSCNFDCFFCYLKDSENSKRTHIRVSEFEEIVKKLPDTKKFYLTGGEPTLHPKFSELLDILEREEKFYSIVSNGSNLKRLHRETRESEFFIGLQISLHDLPKHHAESVGVDTHKIKKIYRDLDTLDFDYDQLALSSNTVVTEYNVSRLPKIVEKINSLGVFDKIVISRYIGDSKHFPNPKQLKNSFKKLKRDYEGRVVIDHLFSPLLDEEFNIFSFCDGGISFLVCDTEGNVYPCPFLKKEEYHQGNLVKEPLETIWESLSDFSEENECKVLKD